MLATGSPVFVNRTLKFPLIQLLSTIHPDESVNETVQSVPESCIFFHLFHIRAAGGPVSKEIKGSVREPDRDRILADLERCDGGGAADIFVRLHRNLLSFQGVSWLLAHLALPVRFFPKHFISDCTSIPAPKEGDGLTQTK
jgi:hypothetical protein